MQLVILMSTQKSHSTYRLAWQNSPSERIPFLPLHRRDLVAAMVGNSTFSNDSKTRINWKKFEVMGEVVLDIRDSQKTPFVNRNRSEDTAKLILETQLSGNEEVIFIYFILSLFFYLLLTTFSFILLGFIFKKFTS